MASEMASPQRPGVLRIHHLKFAVTRLDVSVFWYERVLGARRIPELDHIREDGSRFAVVCELADWNGSLLELREDETQALKDRGWNTVTLLVQSRKDVLDWINWLDRWGSSHSPLLVGPRGWILVFEDPDGRHFRLYTQDQHGSDVSPTVDSIWLPD